VSERAPVRRRKISEVLRAQSKAASISASRRSFFLDKDGDARFCVNYQNVSIGKFRHSVLRLQVMRCDIRVYQ
jgi:hypothetical protein